MEEIIKKFMEDKENKANLEQKLRIAKLHKEKDEEKLQEIINEYDEAKLKKTINKFDENEEEVIKAYKERIEEDGNEISKIEEDIKDVENKMNTIACKRNIQMMTQQIEEMNNKLKELYKRELELQEIYVKDSKENSLPQEYYKENESVRNEIKELQEDKKAANAILDMMKKLRDELVADGKYEEINIKAEEIYMDMDETKKDEAEQDETKKDEAEQDETKKDEAEQDELRKREISDNSQKVRIAYSAKENVFLIENRNGQYTPFRRTMEEINAISLEELAKKMGKQEKDFEDIGEGTILMLKVLSCYDEKFYTNKAAECLDLQGGYKVKKSERNEKMNKAGINIEINLKGLYDKEKRISKYLDREKKVNDADRKSILAVANDMIKTGTGTVKEGIVTKAIKATGKTREKITDSKIAEVASNMFSKIKGKVKLPKVKLPKLLKSSKEDVIKETKQDRVDTKVQEADIEEKVAQAAAKMLDEEKKQKEEAKATKDPGEKLGVKVKGNEEEAAKAARKMLDKEKEAVAKGEEK